MSQQGKLETAMNLLSRVNLEEPPDEEWCRDYFLLTSDHMILTDEGWSQPFLPPDGEGIEISDEVNECRAAPAASNLDSDYMAEIEIYKAFRKWRAAQKKPAVTEAFRAGWLERKAKLAFIGDVRRRLFTTQPSDWNGVVRDVTAKLEQPDMQVDEAEVLKALGFYLRNRAFA